MGERAGSHTLSGLYRCTLHVLCCAGTQIVFDQTEVGACKPEDGYNASTALVPGPVNGVTVSRQPRAPITTLRTPMFDGRARNVWGAGGGVLYNAQVPCSICGGVGKFWLEPPASG